MKDFFHRLRGKLGPSDNVVYDFMLAFSRWEYALKITDGGRYAGHSGRPDDRFLSVKWKEWAEKYAAAWEQGGPQDLATWDIIVRPPQYQAKSASGRLEPVERHAPASQDLKSVLELVYAVRNNLFHGGKWALRDPARDRDERLLNEALALLAAVVDLDPELKKEFYDFGPSLRS